jgi:hypothetical protein
VFRGWVVKKVEEEIEEVEIKMKKNSNIIILDRKSQWRLHRYYK